MQIRQEQNFTSVTDVKGISSIIGSTPHPCKKLLLHTMFYMGLGGNICLEEITLMMS